MARNTWSKGLYTHVLGIGFSSGKDLPSILIHSADGITTYLPHPYSAQDRDCPNVPMLIKYRAYPGDISMARSGRTIWCRLAPLDVCLSQFTKYSESAGVSERDAYALGLGEGSAVVLHCPSVTITVSRRPLNYPDQIRCRDSRVCIFKSSYNCLGLYIALYREFFLSFSCICKPDNLTSLCVSGLSLLSIYRIHA